MATIKVIDFWASWCGPCRVLSPVVDEIKSEYDATPEKGVEVVKINVDENSEETVKYSISSIPTLVYLVDGKEVSRTTGIQTKSQIVQTIQKLANEANLPE